MFDQIHLTMPMNAFSKPLIKVLALVLLWITACSEPQTAQEGLDTSPYSSIFGKNVLVFDETMDVEEIKQTLQALHEQQMHNQFGSERYALLFKPSTYDLDVTVDYYVQALGLGRSPDNVTINGAVQSTTTTDDNKVTVMFWRGAENFKVVPKANEMVYWAVSQAAPYRRMHVMGDINFDKSGWASGGLLANSVVEGRAGLTSGQQWLTRNSRIGYWEGGNWNRVFVGVDGAPADTWPELPTTVIEQTPVVREKPFLTYTESGTYAVFVPARLRETSGPSWGNGATGDRFDVEGMFF